MPVLAVDSATNVASVAIVNEDNVLGEFFLNTQKTHSERLMPLIDQLLKYTDMTLGDINGIAVSIGPGSFTGLRIGLSTVKGLAFFTGKPVVGIPTLDSLARNLPLVEGLICPVIYARRDEVYCALYVNAKSGQERISNYMALSPGELISFLNGIDRKKVVVLGDGLDLFPSDFVDIQGEGFKIAPVEHRLTRASTVGFLSLERLKKGQKDNLDNLVPFYIRASAAEMRLNCDKK